MIIQWPEEMASSWMEIVSWASGVIIGVFAVLRGLILFSRANGIRRAELLRSLLDEYNSDKVAESIQSIEEDKVSYSKTFLMPEKVKASVRLADPALLFFSNICYLRQTGLISAKEFAFFRWKIEKILEKKPVSDYIEDCVANNNGSPYKRILRYRKQNCVWQKILNAFR